MIRPVVLVGIAAFAFAVAGLVLLILFDVVQAVQL